VYDAADHWSMNYVAMDDHVLIISVPVFPMTCLGRGSLGKRAEEDRARQSNQGVFDLGSNDHV
jgi:hypothetical protein